MKYVEILNPSREIKVLNIEETYKVIEDEAKQMTIESISHKLIGGD